MAKVEAEQAGMRARTGRTVLGRRRILRQSWRDSPATYEPRRTLNPRVEARNVWLRVEALQRNKAFVEAYRAARVAWLAGIATVFPPGTSTSLPSGVPGKTDGGRAQLRDDLCARRLEVS